MSAKVFNLNIRFGTSLGGGYVELVVGDETHILASTTNLKVKEDVHIILSAVPSFGNVFNGWVDTPKWIKESIVENSRVLVGKMEDDFEVFVHFEKKPKKNFRYVKDDNKLNLSEREVETKTEYGKLKIKNTIGGSFILRTNKISVMKKSNDFITYDIEVGSNIQLIGSPDENFVFKKIITDSEWARSGYAKMESGEHSIIVEFTKNQSDVKEVSNIIHNEHIEIKTKHKLQPRKRLKNIQNKKILNSENFLSFGMQDDLHESHKNIVNSTPKLQQTNESVEIVFEYKKDDHRKIGPWYYINGKKFHDIILVRGVTYNLICKNTEIEANLKDSSNKLIDLSHEGGDFIGIETSLLFTPNENTPSELNFVLRSDSNENKDSIIHGKLLGKVHIRDNFHYGRVISYGYVKNTNVSYVENGEFKTSAIGENGEFKIQLTGENQLNSITVSGGEDFFCNTSNSVSYKTPSGCMQLNSLTTIIEVGSKRLNTTYHELEKRLKYTLGINFECDLLNDDPIHKFISGHTEYIILYKKMIIVNCLLSFVSYINRQEKIEDLIQYGDFFGNYEIQFSSSNEISKILQSLFDNTPSGLNEISVVLANLFGWIMNLNIDSFAPTWLKLHSFGRIYEQYYLEQLVKTLHDSSDNSAINAWNNFTSKLESVSAEVNLPNVPEYVTIETTHECDNVSTGLLSKKMKVEFNNIFYTNVTKNNTLHINTLKNIYNKVLSVSYGDDNHCYTITEFPVEFNQDLPIFSGTITNYDYESIDECCRNLPDNIFDEGDATDNDTEIFGFKLIESGENNIMFSNNTISDNFPIEYLGNDEYRLYIDQEINSSINQGGSPGYCVIPKKYTNAMEQRYLKIAYNSETSVKPIFLTTYNKSIVQIHFTLMEQRGLMSCYTLSEVNIVPGETITLSESTSNGKINGDFIVASVTSSTLFTIFVEMQTDEKIEDYTTLQAKMENFGGTRVFCDTTDFKIGDTVIFDKTTSGLTYNISEIGTEDGLGTYFTINNVIPTTVKKVVKSHVNENINDVVEFMYTGKMQYYSVCGASPTDERVWITYDPDICPTGRGQHKISYIQFFHNESDWDV